MQNFLFYKIQFFIDTFTSFFIFFGYSVLLSDPQARHSGLQISETKTKDKTIGPPSSNIPNQEYILNNLFFMGPNSKPAQNSLEE